MKVTIEFNRYEVEKIFATLCEDSGTKIMNDFDVVTTINKVLKEKIADARLRDLVATIFTQLRPEDIRKRMTPFHDVEAPFTLPITPPVEVFTIADLGGVGQPRKRKAKKEVQA